MTRPGVASPRVGSACILAALITALCIEFLIPRHRFIASVKAETLKEHPHSSETSDSLGNNVLENRGLVQVDFYGESLCPDCKHLVLDILSPMFDNGIAEFMNLTYIAYGNAKEDVQGDGSIQCQHGPVECRFNRYINCAQNEKHEQEDWFPLVKCLAMDINNIESRAPDCAEEAGFSSEKLLSCADGNQGAQLEREAAVATNSLDPKHTFVPWIIVNGVHEDYENLDVVVCSHITDTVK